MPVATITYLIEAALHTISLLTHMYPTLFYPEMDSLCIV
jgi:hypothetical protein